MAVPARPENPNVTLQTYEELSLPAQVWRRFRRHRLAVVGLAVLGAFALIALAAPWIAPERWDFLDPALRFKPPSARHWLGTDHLGRDVFSRIVWGSRISLSVGFVAAGIAVTIGSLWGAVAGYYGGTALDMLMMRVAEIIDAIPTLILLITMAAVLPRGPVLIMVIIGITSWPSLAKIVRGQFLSLREWDFSQASRALGASDARVILRHILPNALAPIIVSATLRVGNAILAESALSFLGLGVPPPYPTWGQTVATGKDFMRQAYWIAFYPGMAIFLTVLSFNFVGDGLRDALDPKLKR